MIFLIKENSAMVKVLFGCSVIVIIIYLAYQIFSYNSPVIDKIEKDSDLRVKVILALRQTLNDEKAMNLIEGNGISSEKDVVAIKYLLGALTPDFKRKELINRLYIMYIRSEGNPYVGIGHARCSILFNREHIEDFELAPSKVKVEKVHCLD